MSYKFVERGIDVNTSSIPAAVLSFLKMIVFAPYYLVFNISIKVIYLQEEQLKLWLNSSIIFAFCTGVLYAVLAVLLRQTYWIEGEFPIVAPFVAMILLISLRALFQKKLQPMINDVIGLLVNDEDVESVDSVSARGSLSEQGFDLEETSNTEPQMTVVSGFTHEFKENLKKCIKDNKEFEKIDLSSNLIPSEFDTSS